MINRQQILKVNGFWPTLLLCPWGTEPRALLMLSEGNGTELYSIHSFPFSISVNLLTQFTPQLQTAPLLPVPPPHKPLPQPAPSPLCHSILEHWWYRFTNRKPVLLQLGRLSPWSWSRSVCCTQSVGTSARVWPTDPRVYCVDGFHFCFYVALSFWFISPQAYWEAQSWPSVFVP